MRRRQQLDAETQLLTIDKAEAKGVLHETRVVCSAGGELGKREPKSRRRLHR
jgi:hypothetical protein